MRMGEEDGKKLVGGIDAIRDLEAELDAIDRETDPEASERELEILDLMVTLSMGMGPLRKKLATGQNASDAKHDNDMESSGDPNTDCDTQTDESV